MPVNTIYSHASDDVAPNATITVNTGTEDPAYPKANLVDFVPAKPGKLTTTTGSWVFDFGSAQRVDIVALIHHNLTPGLEVRIQGNASDSWGSPTFNQPITIPTYREDGFPVNPWLDLTGLSGYGTGGFRYWRVVVVGVNGAAVAIGEVLLIKLKRSLDPNINWGERRQEDRKLVEHRTDFGVSTIYDLGVTVRELNGDVDASDTQKAAIQSWWRDTKGRSRPFLLVPDGLVNDAWMVRWKDTKLDVQLQFLDRNPIQLGFEEVSRGLVL
jgi:hypothetical protein